MSGSQKLTCVNASGSKIGLIDFRIIPIANHWQLLFLTNQIKNHAARVDPDHPITRLYISSWTLKRLRMEVFEAGGLAAAKNYFPSQQSGVEVDVCDLNRPITCPLCDAAHL
jgi:hypothetical protein